jgi:hypothetical protein
MPLLKKASLSSALATLCLISGLAATAPAHAAQIPDYFFKQWTVAANCAEQHAGLAARVATGLKFTVGPDSTKQGGYVFVAQNSAQQHWAPNWNGMKLEYRAGPKMTTVPADFECIPGQESTSPFLSMSGYAQSSEPYYEQQHWYGIATIQGQREHVLIFPRSGAGGPSAIIVMQSVNSPSTVQLDDNGVIHTE